jgi:hypothetical protein
MNDTLQQFARQTLKDDLALLPEANHRIFKLMYGRNNGKRTVEEAEALPIDTVVDAIPAEKLDWAMQQVKNTFKENERQQPS